NQYFVLIERGRINITVSVPPLNSFKGAVIALVCCFAWGCTAKTAPPQRSTVVPVVVAKVTQKSMPVEITAVGNVEPISTVSIKAQIAGELLEVHFKEGDFVRKGQLLFTIDSRIPQGQVGTMQANIEKDEAQLKQAEANLARDTAQ